MECFCCCSSLQDALCTTTPVPTTSPTTTPCDGECACKEDDDCDGSCGCPAGETAKCISGVCKVRSVGPKNTRNDNSVYHKMFISPHNFQDCPESSKNKTVLNPPLTFVIDTTK